ncbi:Alcohol dehydrogenase class-P [Platanthera zijinensis]|uniref:alcohol dehydrogenase n=1 Tax=Platanthera zijinensis TaxID=2320716 RepID=A0AAP0AXN5_9ASPA
METKNIKGTIFENYKPRSDLPALVEKCMNMVNLSAQELELEKFITHDVPLPEINKAFEYLIKGESLRCVICME